jgi:hypothetical protein
MRTHFFMAIIAMSIVVIASNYLVQFPVEAKLFSLDLAAILTWGAFTYPIAFLVTDLTNRNFGAKSARRVALIGFAIAVIWSIFLASPRIAIASGSAFFIAQFLDISIFNRLKGAAWWLPPFISSFIGSLIDTILFFALAFASQFAFLDIWFGNEDSSLAFAVPFLSVGGDVELWVSLATGDFIVKIFVALILLLPYGLLRKRDFTQG